MGMLFTILTILVIVASLLITLIVLLQNGKGGGLASNFAAGNQTFGVRQTADILEKITWVLVVFVFVVSIITSVAGSNSKKGIKNFSSKENENILNTVASSEDLGGAIESLGDIENPIEQ